MRNIYSCLCVSHALVPCQLVKMVQIELLLFVFERLICKRGLIMLVSHLLGIYP